MFSYYDLFKPDEVFFVILIGWNERMIALSVLSVIESNV